MLVGSRWWKGIMIGSKLAYSIVMLLFWFLLFIILVINVWGRLLIGMFVC